MNKGHPQITFIIATYNMEQYISCCLDSVLEQTRNDYEVICVNDGSTDESEKIINEYVKRNSNIKLVNCDGHLGAAYARNIGLESARGNYIFFLDADDWIRKDAVERLLSIVNLSEPDLILYNYANIFPNSNHRWKTISLHDYDNKSYTGQVIFSKLIRDKQFNIALCTRLYRRSFLEANNLRFVSGVNTEDSIFVFLCMMNAKRVEIIDDILYFYRRRYDSVSVSVTKRRANSLFYSILEILHYWKSNEFSDDVNEAIKLYIQERYGTFLWLKERVGISPYVQYGHEADKFILKMYCDNFIEKKEYLHISQKDFEEIRRAKHIFIYGAGKYGKELFDKLYDENIDIEAFLVTSSKENYVEICRDHPVFSLDMWDFPNNAFVIIAASINYRNEMIQTLKEYNFKNFYVVT